MKPSFQILPLSFYQRATKTVARELLGKILIRTLPSGVQLIGKIVETEAYLGIKDRAAHTYGDRKTARTIPMYGDGGQAYVYLIYGLYECFNVVTQSVGIPEAVLVRAIEPLSGLEEMKKFRNTEKISELCSGPGKLCMAFQINRTFNEHQLNHEPLVIADPEGSFKKMAIVSTTRIGVDFAGSDALRKLRFYIKGNNFISKK